LSKEVKLSFRAIVVGNERGQVGIELVAGDVIGAVRKGVADGKNTGDPTKSNSIHPTNGIGGGAR